MTCLLARSQHRSGTGLQCLAQQQLQQRQPWPSLQTGGQRQRAARRRSRPLPAMAYHHDSLGSASDRAKRLEDADQRSVASAARCRENSEVLERVDQVIESVPPCGATYTLRLLCHAVDLPQVAQEQKDSLDADFYAMLKVVLQSQAFREATDGHAPGNTPEMASAVLQVFDSAWRAALQVRPPSGQ